MIKRQGSKETLRLTTIEELAEQIRQGAFAEQVQRLRTYYPLYGGEHSADGELTGFEEYTKATQKEKKDTVLEQTGWSDEQLQAFVDELPDVKAAKEAKQRYEQAEQQRVIDAQLAEVAKLDPSIKSLEDLQKQENYASIYFLVVRKGLSLSDAYKLANFDKISSARASSAAKQAERNAKGKEHLQPTSQRGEGSVAVPADVMEMYKALNPKATNAEITAHYNKNLKG